MCLFRYCESKYVDDFLMGNLSFGHWSIYNDDALSEAQRDTENSRESKRDGKNSGFLLKGQPMRGLKDFTIKLKLKSDVSFYLLCLSNTFNYKMYPEFRANTCIEINDYIEFVKRLNLGLYRAGYRALIGNVKYYPKNQIVYHIANNRELMFSKYDKYQYQQEHRIAVDTNTQNYGERMNVSIGRLDDICKIMDKA